VKIRGFVSVASVTASDGRVLTAQQAVDYGFINPVAGDHRGWGLTRDEIPLGENLFVDQGRQLLAYCFAGTAPLGDYVCSKFAVGTNPRPPRVTDTALVAPVTLSGGSEFGTILGVEFLGEFTVRVSFRLGLSDANGMLIQEMGLFSGNNVMFARRTNVGINKTSDFSPLITWRLRF
jgi:hypothetical protein